MGREQKKGKAGNAKAFITRAKALKKLQLSLPEWRRLCIIKGVYPRDPKKKVEGADKTYYLRKDVDFLAHERLIDTIRAQNTHRRKVVKAKAKKQLDVLKSLVLKAPQANLDHIIVERFPRFEDALRELDDPLCVVALFSMLPSKSKVGIAPARVANCKRLMNEFLNFVSRTHALRRVFISIKGYYYQAEIDGELVTWIMPHRFTQKLPSDVDYSVMLTFLELYECMMNFVNYRLYTRQNLAYPPKIDAAADAVGLELAAVRAEPDAKKSTEKEGATKPALSEAAIAAALASANAVADEEEESDEDDDGGDAMDEDSSERGDQDPGDDGSEGSADGEEIAVNGKVEEDVEQDAALDAPREDDDDRDEVVERELLFGGKVVVLGRETPMLELEFVLKASGAKEVIRQDSIESDDADTLAGVTHWIIDRPAVSGTRVMSIEYVQPQFVFDSVNAGVLLPPALYAPGAKLPPHLSPFVADEEDGGYRPWFKDVVERIKSGDTSVIAEAAVSAYAKSATPVGGTKAVSTKAGELGEKAKSGSLQKPEGSDVEDKDEDGDEGGDKNEDELDDDGEVGHEKDEGGQNEDDDEDEEDEEDDDDDDDEDDQSESAEEDADTVAENEKELKLVMMSRKKRKQYDYYAKEEQKKKDRKASLTAKRSLLTQNEAGEGSAKKRKRKSSA